MVAYLALHVEVPLLRLPVPKVSRKDEKAGRTVCGRNGRQQIGIRYRDVVCARVGEGLNLNAVLRKCRAGKDGRSYGIKYSITSAKNSSAIVRGDQAKPKRGE